MIYGIKPSECNQFIRLSSDKILGTLAQNDILVIYGYHLSYLGNQEHKNTRNTILNINNEISTNSKEKIEIYINSIKSFVKKANKKGIKTIFIASTLRNNIPHPEWFRPLQKNNHNENYLVAAQYVLMKWNDYRRDGIPEIENVVIHTFTYDAKNHDYIFICS